MGDGYSNDVARKLEMERLKKQKLKQDIILKSIGITVLKLANLIKKHNEVRG